MANLSPNQRRFIQGYASASGIDPRLIAAQLIAEEPAGANAPVGHNDQNWLNIGNTDSRWFPGAAAWKDPYRAGRRSALWTRGKLSVPGFGRAAPGIVAFSRTSGQPLQSQIRALQHSGWASSGYPNLGSLVQQVGGVGVDAAQAGPVASPGQPRFRTQTRNVLDRQGFDAAQRRFELGQLLRNARSPFQDFGPRAGIQTQNPLLRVLPQEAPLPEEYTRAVTSLKRLAGGLAVGAPLASSNLPSGVVKFEGTPLAAWIAPILAYARQQGWKGSVTSGFRSYAEQKRIYDSGVRPAAVPGTSNHEGDVFPRGAVDVSDAQTLARILARSPYRGRLVWAGSKDPVHFSHPHNGSY